MRYFMSMVVFLTAAGSIIQSVGGEEMKLGAHGMRRDLTGSGVIDEKCVACHNRQRIEDAMRKRKNMEEIRKRMEGKGAALTDHERSVLSHFWHKNPFKEQGKDRKEGERPAR